MPEPNIACEPATLIIGCGYVGKTVASVATRLFPAQRVYATTRSSQKAALFSAAGIEPVIADWTDRRTLQRLPKCSRVLVAVSYDPRGGISREQSQVGGLANLLDFLPPECDICYLSTTGVYHQTDGSWVDESSPARPNYDGGLAHLRAEQLLHRRRAASPWCILRLAGIYGTGRVPRIADVLAGRPLDGSTDGYLNLIHVDDIAGGVVAAWQRHQRAMHRERLYVVSDDKPVIRRRFYEQIALLGRVAPPIFTSDLPTEGSPRTTGSGQRSSFLSARSASNKRIWNRRFRRDLRPRLTYGDYVAGLASIPQLSR